MIANVVFSCSGWGMCKFASYANDGDSMGVAWDRLYYITRATNV